MTLSEAKDKLAFLFASDDAIEADEAAVAKLPDNAAQVLDASIEVLEDLEPFDAEHIQAALRARLVEELGIKPRFAFSPARVALTGTNVSPPLFESMELLGREATLARLRRFRAGR